MSAEKIKKPWLGFRSHQIAAGTMIIGSLLIIIGYFMPWVRGRSGFDFMAWCIQIIAKLGNSKLQLAGGSSAEVELAVAVIEILAIILLLAFSLTFITAIAIWLIAKYSIFRSSVGTALSIPIALLVLDIAWVVFRLSHLEHNEFANLILSSFVRADRATGGGIELGLLLFFVGLLIAGVGKKYMNRIERPYLKNQRSRSHQVIEGGAESQKLSQEQNSSSEVDTSKAASSLKWILLGVVGVGVLGVGIWLMFGSGSQHGVRHQRLDDSAEEAKANVGDIRTAQLAFYDDDLGGDGRFAENIQELGWTFRSRRTRGGGPCYYQYGTNNQIAWATSNESPNTCGYNHIEIELRTGALSVR
jgi:hypothetical protein